MTLADRYQDRLASIPPPGGNGCHPALLACANLGVLQGLDPAVIHADIRAHIPTGGRRVADKEIQDAINRALRDHDAGGSYQAPPPPTVKNGEAVLKAITSKATIKDEYELWEASPIRFLDGPQHDPELFLSSMFKPTDLVFIGDRLEPGVVGQNIRTATVWVRFFQAGGTAGPFVLTNPLTGRPAPKKAGDGETYRGDGCIAEYKYALGEFDGLDLETQIKFWSAVDLPVKALVYSGNKSIHGWIDVRELAGVESADAWDRHVKGRLFRGLLEPVGVDPACKNSARLARLPGFYRTGKQAWQRILWMGKNEKDNS